MPWVEIGLVAIIAALVLGLVWSRVSAAQTIGRLKAELAALRATEGANVDAVAAMSQIPDTEAGARRIHDAAKARAEKKKPGKKR